MNFVRYKRIIGIKIFFFFMKNTLDQGKTGSIPEAIEFYGLASINSTNKNERSRQP